jgi:hypothetical protein
VIFSVAINLFHRIAGRSFEVASTQPVYGIIKARALALQEGCSTKATNNLKEIRENFATACHKVLKACNHSKTLNTH